MEEQKLMTEQDTKIDGWTKRALDLAIARKQVNQASYRAVIRGEISLAEAKAIGRDGAPAADITKGRSGPGESTEAPRASTKDGADTPRQDAPAGPRLRSRISKNDRLSPCVCGCGKLVENRFATGHDMRMFRVAREHLTEGRELTDEQREYLVESGKMERVRVRLVEEDACKQQEGGARKTTRKGSR
jgi:hypothetical protein